MTYLPVMTLDEIHYICSVIPLQDSESYFKRYPKDFARIMPGFRATSLKNQDIVSGILFRNRNQNFISSFIEKHISRWLVEIAKVIAEKIEEGKSKETALLQTLPYCYFADNIGLYFKLTGEDYTEECLSILSASITIIKDSEVEREKLETKFKTKTTEFNRGVAELGRVQTHLNKISKNQSDYINEIKNLKCTISNMNKLKENFATQEHLTEILKQKVREQESYIQNINLELFTLRKEQQQRENKIREEVIKQQVLEYDRQESARKPKCPKDRDEFKDYFGYNIENLGVPTDSDYYALLKDYMSEILFLGRPIIVSRMVGLTIMKCVSNALIKSPTIPTLAFSANLTDKEIDSFLSNDMRIVCLDNFLGNYNETTLITACEKHKDKIIFLTVIYDRALYYVPDELFKYCHYLNLNRIEALLGNKDLTEDPSFIDEYETLYIPSVLETRWSSFLKNLLNDFGISDALSTYKSRLVIDELSLCRLLAFDILPYCVDVLKISPFNASAKLVNYAGDKGRCSYKSLFWRWFT